MENFKFKQSMKINKESKLILRNQIMGFFFKKKKKTKYALIRNKILKINKSNYKLGNKE